MQNETVDQRVRFYVQACYRTLPTQAQSGEKAKYLVKGYTHDTYCDHTDFTEANGIALATGPMAALWEDLHLIALDDDSAGSLHDAFKAAFTDIFPRLEIARSTSGRGFHLFFISPFPIASGAIDGGEIKGVTASGGWDKITAPSANRVLQNYHNSVVLTVEEAESVAAWLDSKRIKKAAPALIEQPQRRPQSSKDDSLSGIAALKQQLDPVAILQSYGYQYAGRCDDGVEKFRCADSSHRRGDKRPSLRFNPKTGRIWCNSSACQHSKSVDIVGFIAQKEGITVKEVLRRYDPLGIERRPQNGPRTAQNGPEQPDEAQRVKEAQKAQDAARKRTERAIARELDIELIRARLEADETLPPNYRAVGLEMSKDGVQCKRSKETLRRALLAEGRDVSTRTIQRAWRELEKRGYGKHIGGLSPNGAHASYSPGVFTFAREKVAPDKDEDRTLYRETVTDKSVSEIDDQANDQADTITEDRTPYRETLVPALPSDCLPIYIHDHDSYSESYIAREKEETAAAILLDESNEAAPSSIDTWWGRFSQPAADRAWGRYQLEKALQENTDRQVHTGVEQASFLPAYERTIEDDELLAVMTGAMDYSAPAAIAAAPASQAGLWEIESTSPSAGASVSSFSLAPIPFDGKRPGATSPAQFGTAQQHDPAPEGTPIRYIQPRRHLKYVEDLRQAA